MDNKSPRSIWIITEEDGKTIVAPFIVKTDAQVYLRSYSRFGYRVFRYREGQRHGEEQIVYKFLG